MPSIQENCLANGLTILSCQLPHLHSIQMNVYMKGGCLYETEETQGVGHLVEHMMFRSMNGMDRNTLYRKLDAIGARMRGHIFRDAVTFNMKVSPRYFDPAFAILCQLFQPGTFDENDVAKEKEVVCRQIENTESTFLDEAQRAFWHTEAGAFKLRGTTQAVNELSLDTIQEEKEKLFALNNICVAITGNFSDGMLDKIVAELSDLPDGLRVDAVQMLPDGFLSRNEDSCALLPERCARAQVQLSFDIDDTILYDVWVQMLSALIGNGSCSPLLSCLRDEKALTADIYTDIERVGAYRRLTINYQVSQQGLEESLCTTFEILSRIRQHVGPDQMSRIGVFFGDNLHFAYDNAKAVNKYLARAWMNDTVDQCDFETLDQLYRDTTAEDVQDTAQTLLKADNLWMQVRFDPDKVSEKSLKETLARCREILK